MDAAKGSPEAALDDLPIDASAAHLVREPERFDAIVATDFDGDILSDLASELPGRLGPAGSIMARDTTSMILSVAMLLQSMGDHHGAEASARAGGAITAAVDTVPAGGASRTRDLGGPLGCRAFDARRPGPSGVIPAGGENAASPAATIPTEGRA